MAANNPTRPEAYRERLALDVANFRCLAGPAQSEDIHELFADLDMTKCVSIETLVSEPDGDYRDCFIVAIIASITPSNGNSATLNRGGPNGARRGGNLTQVTYHRLFRFLCLSSSAHGNIFAIMQGQGCGGRLFNLDLTKRDDGTFRPGTIVVLEDLKGVRSFMGNGETPILEYQNHLIPVAANLVLPEVLPNRTTNLGGFIFVGQVEVIALSIFDSPCAGLLCDDAENLQDGRIRPRCPCIQMVQRTGNPMIALTLKITFNAGTVIQVNNYCSKNFLKTHVYLRPLPPGFRAERMSNWRTRRVLNNTLNNLFRAWNDAGGVQIVGWAKPGMVQDQLANAGQNANQYGAQPVMVQSGSLVYHISSLAPAFPMRLDPNVMEGLKVDFSGDGVARAGGGGAGRGVAGAGRGGAGRGVAGAGRGGAGRGAGGVAGMAEGEDDDDNEGDGMAGGEDEGAARGNARARRMPPDDETDDDDDGILLD